MKLILRGAVRDILYGRNDRWSKAIRRFTRSYNRNTGRGEIGRLHGQSGEVGHTNARLWWMALTKRGLYAAGVKSDYRR